MHKLKSAQENKSKMKQQLIAQSASDLESNDPKTQQVYLPELLERVSAGKIFRRPATYRSAEISKSSHL